MKKQHSSNLKYVLAIGEWDLLSDMVVNGFETIRMDCYTAEYYASNLSFVLT